MMEDALWQLMEWYRTSKRLEPLNVRVPDTKQKNIQQCSSADSSVIVTVRSLASGLVQDALMVGQRMQVRWELRSCTLYNGPQGLLHSFCKSHMTATCPEALFAISKAWCHCPWLLRRTAGKASRSWWRTGVRSVV